MVLNENCLKYICCCINNPPGYPVLRLRKFIEKQSEHSSLSCPLTGHNANSRAEVAGIKLRNLCNSFFICDPDKKREAAYQDSLPT